MVAVDSCSIVSAPARLASCVAYAVQRQATEALVKVLILSATLLFYCAACHSLVFGVSPLARRFALLYFASVTVEIVNANAPFYSILKIFVKRDQQCTLKVGCATPTHPYS